jgi:carbon-monoxide dehydrogenase large subunit
VGEPVVLVVAETLGQAQDAADLVTVDYEELAPVTDLRDAVAPGAPQLWPEAPQNIAIDWPGPVADDGTNEREVDAIIAAAPHVARLSLVNQRIAVASLETRGATAAYDAAEDLYTLHCCTQSVGTLREQLMATMGLKREQVRVLTDDVGGAFGMKTSVYPEYPALLVAARRLGRPVHWMSTRGEAFLTDNQARDTITEAALAIDRDGRFLALKVGGLSSLGAYASSHGAFIATSNFARCFPGMYRIPRIAVGMRCVFTNTAPTGPYRGAGRPEANYALERLVDEAARVTGIDRVELRRRNLLKPAEMPYRTAVGTVYDSGDFAPLLDQALDAADAQGFPERRRRAEAEGKRRGLGVSCFLEHSGGVPQEGAMLAFPGGAVATLALGAQATGQGHATVFGRLAAERLGIAPEQVAVREGDTRLEVLGSGTVASRSAMTVGSAVLNTVAAVIAKGRKVAALALEAAEADIGYRDGMFEVTGTDRRLSLFDAAAAAVELKRRGEIEETLDTNLVSQVPQSFPNGCHVAEVEIDADTGVVSVVAYVAVDDCGAVLDETIVEAQVQGGMAQGLGQALLEHAVYDRGSGQLVAGSFMDYAMPRALDVPDIRGRLRNTPCTTNPLGVKGVGEAGTTGALAAFMNAVADAIPGEAGARLQMPATPDAVWRALRCS